MGLDWRHWCKRKTLHFGGFINLVKWVKVVLVLKYYYS